MEKLKNKLNEFIQSAKTWSLVEWIINLRYVGYILILLHGWLTMRITIPDLVIYGGIIGLIERQIRKK
jgi:DMSO/TMAO reductase YedYZ heme-binding membrane subunit